MEDRSRALTPEELRAQIRALDEQVKLLVKAEQRLFLSRRDLARQLARQEALNRFALGAVRAPSAGAVLELAAETLLRIYAFDQCLAVLADAAGELRPVAVRAVSGREGAGADRLAIERHGPPWRGRFPEDAACGVAGAVRAEHPDAAPLLDAMERLFGGDPALRATHDGSFVLVLPLAVGERGAPGALILRRLSPDKGYHEELPTAADAEFLRRAAQQVSAAVSAGKLVEELRESYQELARAQSGLVRRERLAALGELAAVVAHEVRNPLGVIFNSVASLRRILRPSGEVGVLLGIVREEADRLARIVNDLIEFARPDPPELSPARLERIIAEAVESATASWPETAAAIAVEPAGDLPAVRCDARMLRQAMINLLTNSLQATEGRGPVTVRTTDERRGGAAFVRIEVADGGAGIAEPDLGRIFEPFFTTKPSGTGLGLAVVKRFTDAHQGHIDVRSAPGKGSTFSIRLPLS